MNDKIKSAGSGTPTKTTGTKTRATAKTSVGWTDDEVAAMKNRAQELKTEARAKKDKADAEKEVLAKIAEMSESDRRMAQRIHAIVKAAAPTLTPKTWYGMPAYANQDGKNVCFFQPAEKFKGRYATLGFNEDASLDEGSMWPTSWALTKLTAANEAKIRALVKRASN